LTLISEYQKLPTRQQPSSRNWAARPRWPGSALSAPYRWQHEKSRGETGGLIPQPHHRRLLDYADAHGIALTAEEFLIRRAGGPPGAG
jgi:hypothetical protein